MKKFILVLICIAILLFFVAFNYLIWDRDKKAEDIENLKWTNTNNISNINYLTRQIETLQEEKKVLEKKITDLEEDVKFINGNLADAQSETEELKTIIAGKDVTISVLKEQVDPDMLYSFIERWVVAMNDADFKTAHEIQYGHAKAGANYRTIQEFEMMYADKLQEITVVSAALIDNIDAKGKELPKMFIFEVELNAVFDPEAAAEVLPGQLIVNGQNKLLIKIDFDESANDWFMANMSIFVEPTQP